MSKTAHFLAETARVGAATIQPLLSLRKVFVTGSCPDIRVTFRKITLSPTRAVGAGEESRPLLAYDASSPNTDYEANIDLHRSLPKPRRICLKKESRDE